MIIHQENRGLSGARNTGLLHTGAKYVMFLDSDDCLAPVAVEKLVSVFERETIDIVSGSYSNFRGVRFLRKDHLQKEGAADSELDFAGHAWGKLYRRELFEKVQFPEKYWFEDSLMHQIVFPQARKLYGIRNIVYLRRINPASITQNAAGNPKSLDSLWVTLRLMEDREKLGIPKTPVYYRYLLRQARINHIRLREMSREIREAAFTVMAGRLQQAFPDGDAASTEEEALEKAVKSMDFELFEKL